MPTNSKKQQEQPMQQTQDLYQEMKLKRQEKLQNQQLQSRDQNTLQREEKLNNLAPDLQIVHDLRWKYPRNHLLGYLRIIIAQEAKL